MALLQPGFFDAVVAIGVATSDGNKRWFATGFLYGKLVHKDGEKASYSVYLVTNRHVLENETLVYVRFDGSKGGTLEFDIDLLDENKNSIWTGHPNPAVDIAVISIDGDFLKESGAKHNFFRGDQHVISRAECKSAGIIEGNPLFLLGFPLGIVGDSQNYVVVRGGDIARIRDCLDGRSDTFLVSIPTFPGNSGGPILTKPEVVSITGTTAFSKGVLIGIITAYLPYRDTAISQQTKKPRIIFEENSGLAIAHPVDLIVETIVEAERTFKHSAKPEPTTNEQSPSDSQKKE